MDNNSSRVLTNQIKVHPKLARISVEASNYVARYPVRLDVLNICEKIKRDQTEYDRQVLLDCGCGSGDSTINIAESYPNYLVIGIDKSLKRLAQARQKIRSENVKFIAVNLVEFWIGLKLVNASIAANFILYPNPWPKQKHLKRRWHAHPVMSILPLISEYIELRTNWRVYGDEFSARLFKLTGSLINLERIYPNEPISAFEKKYFESDHDLFRLRYGRLNAF